MHQQRFGVPFWIAARTLLACGALLALLEEELGHRKWPFPNHQVQNHSHRYLPTPLSLHHRLQAQKLMTVRWWWWCVGGVCWERGVGGNRTVFSAFSALGKVAQKDDSARVKFCMKEVTGAMFRLEI